MCQDDVARGSKASPASVRPTLDECDDRLLHAADRVKNVRERFGVVDMLLSRGVQHLFERRQISAGAKVRTISINCDDSHGRLAQCK